jgi:signal transduction histidine kinase
MNRLYYSAMPEKLKILILEDNPIDADLTIRTLNRSELNFECCHVENKSDFMFALNNFRPNVVLSDHSLPDFSSTDALPMTQKMCESCVFILVTGTVSEEFAVKMLKAGADDYLLKSSLTRLPSAITNAHTKKIAEIEGKKTLKKLVEVNNELKTFMYRASHDIRGPVSSIRGLINVAKIESYQGELKKLIYMMDVSAEKLDKILIDLIETLGIRDQEIHKTKIDFEKLVYDILREYEHLSKIGSIRFSVDIGADTPFYSDPHILSMMLKRIIENAVKFHNYTMPGSYVNIKITEEKNGLNISIIDNGTGIKEDLNEKVFEMFYRANSETGGSGLGLYLVKIAAEKLGGKVNLKSKEQMGTTVNVFLPAC